MALTVVAAVNSGPENEFLLLGDCQVDGKTELDR